MRSLKIKIKIHVNQISTEPWMDVMIGDDTGNIFHLLQMYGNNCKRRRKYSGPMLSGPRIRRKNKRLYRKLSSFNNIYINTYIFFDRIFFFKAYRTFKLNIVEIFFVNLKFDAMRTYRVCFANRT